MSRSRTAEQIEELYRPLCDEQLEALAATLAELLRTAPAAQRRNLRRDLADTQLELARRFAERRTPGGTDRR